jgi:hypothetical protein
MLRELQSHMFCLLTIIQSHIIPVVSGDVTFGLHSYQRLQNCVSMVTIDGICFVRHVTPDYKGYTRKEKEIRVGL